jgi:site-specific recombinase XerD
MSADSRDPSTACIRWTGTRCRHCEKLKATSTSPFAFVSERGSPLSSDMIARIVQRAGETAKLGFHVHPHMLRHATGYALANDGTDTRLIQDFLGHASIANTVRYTKLAPGRLAAVRIR